MNAYREQKGGEGSTDIHSIYSKNALKLKRRLFTYHITDSFGPSRHNSRDTEQKAKKAESL